MKILEAFDRGSKSPDSSTTRSDSLGSLAGEQEQLDANEVGDSSVDFSRQHAISQPSASLHVGRAASATQIQRNQNNMYEALPLEVVDDTTSNGEGPSSFGQEFTSFDDDTALNSQREWEMAGQVAPLLGPSQIGAASNVQPATGREARLPEAAASNVVQNATTSPTTTTGTSRQARSLEQARREMQQLLEARRHSEQANVTASTPRQSAAAATQLEGWQHVALRPHYPANSQDAEPCAHPDRFIKIKGRLGCHDCRKIQTSFVYRCSHCLMNVCADCKRSRDQFRFENAAAGR